MNFGILDEARAELDTAMAYYEARRPGLGLEMLEEAVETVEKATRFPESGAPPSDLLKPWDVRKNHLRRFSFSIVVGCVGGERKIIAVAHQRRRPGYWQRRLCDE
jgi:hypothetical protein